MKCTECQAEIPESQVICPACYATPGQPGGPNGEGVKPSIVVVLTDDAMRGIYERRITDLLQGDFVAWSFTLANGEELEETTASSREPWRLLLTDSATYASAAVAVGNFRTRFPNALVAVLDTGSSNLAGAGVTVLRTPQSEDAWLRMMHQLLRAAAR